MPVELIRPTSISRLQKPAAACSSKVEEQTIVRFAMSTHLDLCGQTLGRPTLQPSQLTTNDQEVRTKLLGALEEVQQPEVWKAIPGCWLTENRAC